MKIVDALKYNLAYAFLPYKRNQDVIIIESKSKNRYVIAVVDGWNKEEELPGNKPGLDVAKLVAEEYPSIFWQKDEKDIKKRAQKAADEIEEKVNEIYKKWASAVALFLFHENDRELIVSVGDVEAYLWKGSKWYKPRQLSDHAIDPTKHASNVSHFFGHTFRSDDPIFSHEPDLFFLENRAPIVIATDGIKNVLSIKDISKIVGNPNRQPPKTALTKLFKEIQKRKTQKDDISILVRW